MLSLSYQDVFNLLLFTAKLYTKAIYKQLENEFQVAAILVS